MSNNSAGLEFLEDVKINIMHALCKKNFDIFEAEKIAAHVRTAIMTGLPGNNIYIPNLRGLCGKGRRQQVIDLYNDGKNAKEIIKLTGLASSTVYPYIRSRNEKPTEPAEQSGIRNNTLKEIKLHAAKSLLSNRVHPVTCKEIVESLCIFLQKNWSGIIISFATAGLITAEGALLSRQDQARLLFDDYNNGMSRANLALKYSLSKEQVKGAIRRMKGKIPHV